MFWPCPWAPSSPFLRCGKKEREREKEKERESRRKRERVGERERESSLSHSLSLILAHTGSKARIIWCWRVGWHHHISSLPHTHNTHSFFLMDTFLILSPSVAHRQRKKKEKRGRTSPTKSFRRKRCTSPDWRVFSGIGLLDSQNEVGEGKQGGRGEGRRKLGDREGGGERGKKEIE